MKKFVLGSIVVLFCFTSFSIKTFAAGSSFVGSLNNNNKSNEGATLSGITVSPVLSTIDVNKGQSLVHNITVYDNNPYPVTISMVYSNFISANQYGQPSFEGLTNAEINDNDISVSSPYNINIPSHKIISIPITISATSYALPREYFISAFAKITKNVQNNSSTVNLSGAVGSLMLIRVSGNSNQSGFIKTFSAENAFYTQTPINFTTNFVDTGNVHLDPQGVIDIYNMFGTKVATIPFNSSRNIVLPVGVNSRIFKSTWNSNNLLIGQYTAKLIVSFGYNTITTTESDSSFWIIPFWFIIIAIVLILFILWQIISRMLRR
jgi:hypothetical protein